MKAHEGLCAVATSTTLCCFFFFLSPAPDFFFHKGAEMAAKVDLGRTGRGSKKCVLTFPPFFPSFHFSDRAETLQGPECIYYL